MTNEKTATIMRLRDGCIDYRYYAARGTMAKNRELKRVAGKLLAPSPAAARILPSLLTVVLLALFF